MAINKKNDPEGLSTRPCLQQDKGKDTFTLSWGWLGPDPLFSLGWFSLSPYCRIEGGDESGILKVTILPFVSVTALVSSLICEERSELVLTPIYSLQQQQQKNRNVKNG